jgi:hypothetical protein
MIQQRFGMYFLATALCAFHFSPLAFCFVDSSLQVLAHKLTVGERALGHSPLAGNNVLLQVTKIQAAFIAENTAVIWTARGGKAAGSSVSTQFFKFDLIFAASVVKTAVHEHFVVQIAHATGQGEQTLNVLWGLIDGTGRLDSKTGEKALAAKVMLAGGLHRIFKDIVADCTKVL